MENGGLAYRREFPAQREMCFSPTEKPPQDYTGSHPVPWGRSYASMERTFLSHRKRRARRQEVGGRKTGKKMQCAAPAIAARCIKHRSALPFRGLHLSPLTASHSRPSVMPQQTKSCAMNDTAQLFPIFYSRFPFPLGDTVSSCLIAVAPGGRNSSAEWSWPCGCGRARGLAAR